MPESDVNKFRKFCETLVPQVGSIATIGLSFTLAVALILNGFTALDSAMTPYYTETSLAAVSSAKGVKRVAEIPANTTAVQESARIIIKYKDNPPGITKALARANLEKAEGLKKVAEIEEIGAVVYAVDEDTAEESVARIKATKKEQIEYAEIDMLVPLAMTPNDPYFSSSWHHTKMQTPIAWDTTQGSGITVATLDTGVDLDHPDLVGSTVNGWNFYDGNTNVEDIAGHGTLVAGTMAAIGNNGLGVIGVSPLVKNMAIRIANPDTYAYHSTMAQGITYAANNGARVVNISYGSSCNASVVNDAANYLRSKGGVVVISAGNTGADNGMGATTGTICVSATNSSDALASWSSYGASIDVGAPGVSIYTTKMGGGYGAANGTSFAAPNTASVYALMFAVNPDLSPAQADSILFSTAQDLGTAGWDKYFGWGRINAQKAVALAASTTGNSTVDRNAPTAPINLAVLSAQYNQVALSWGASIDDVLVSAYNVYRDGVKVATVSGTQFYDSSVSSLTSYIYEVSASDKSGNESAKSTAVTATTPEAPFMIESGIVSTKTNTSATFSVVLSKPGDVVIRYGTSPSNLSGTVMSATPSATSHTVSISNLSARTTYYYTIEAKNTAGNSDTLTASFKTLSGSKRK